jgi:anti-sigma B factor antagonist
MGRDGLVVVAGEIDIATAPLLASSIEEAAAISEGAIVVDMTDVSFMDASGLQVLTGAAVDLAAMERSLSVRSPSHAVRRVLEITDLDSFLLPAREA